MATPVPVHSSPAAANAMRDLFTELGESQVAPQAKAAQAEAPAAASAVSPLSYRQAQQLMALGRAQGPQALTLAQHHAIWDCLQALPASQAWLSAQLQALQGELQER